LDEARRFVNVLPGKVVDGDLREGREGGRVPKYLTQNDFGIDDKEALKSHVGQPFHRRHVAPLAKFDCP